MRKSLGTFRYSMEIGDARGEHFEEVMAWVDTGALYSQFPAEMLERLGYRPNATRSFRLADGSIVETPIGDARIRVGTEVRIVTCVFAEEGSDPLMGATALEAFSLAADPVNETLNPIIALRL